MEAVFGELDYLINGEGVAEGRRYPALQEPEDLLKEMLKVNSLGPYFVGTSLLACFQQSAPLHVGSKQILQGLDALDQLYFSEPVICYLHRICCCHVV